jgi:hypothetical protein
MDSECWSLRGIACLAPGTYAKPEGQRQRFLSGGWSVRHDKLRAALVITELAVSLPLLAGAGLLMHSFVHLANVPPGFNPEGGIDERRGIRTGVDAHRSSSPVLLALLGSRS